MKQNAQVKQSPLKIVAIILAVIVAVLFVSAALRISETAQGNAYEFGEFEYSYTAERGHYGMLYDTAVQDMSKYATYSEKVKDCRALGFYYEQAVLEHAYRTTGDTAKADGFAERMKEYESQLGSMADKAGDVLKAIGD